MPVIANLRNPFLKGRHWEAIEGIIGQKLPTTGSGEHQSALSEERLFTFKCLFAWFVLLGGQVSKDAEDEDAFLTLRNLDDWGTFENAEAIEEVSGQASGEASLETMLKKVNKLKC